MIDVTLPDTVWQGVEEGTEVLVERWLVSEGSRVRAGQLLATVVVVKASIDIEAPASGILQVILVPENRTVGKGMPIGVLRDDSGTA